MRNFFVLPPIKKYQANTCHRKLCADLVWYANKNNLNASDYGMIFAVL
jgi:hypothetical protein